MQAQVLHLRKYILYVIIIGILFPFLSQAEENNPEMGDGVHVTVEPSNVTVTKVEGEYKLIPYEQRRTKWGTLFGLGYSSYEPVFYEAHFVAPEISEPYTTAEMPLIELQLIVKRNLAFGSVGVDMGVGIYQNESDDEAIPSTLDIQLIRVGGLVALDMIWPEPYVVPYALAGAYTIFFSDSMGNTSFTGNTQISYYFSGGAMFQLDWMDRKSSRISYQDTGMENTFAYVEARKIMASAAEKDPDFESDIHWNAGVRVEF